MTEDPETDAEIIARSWDEPTAFAAIFDRHYDAIHRFLWGRIGDAAEDAAAETFRIAFERRRDYDTDYPSAKPWLFGIAARLTKKHYRRRARTRDLRRRAGAERTDAIAGPEQRLNELALSSPVADALMQLPERDRDPLLLHAWEELTYEEIARAVDAPVGTVRSRIHRARRAVREHLEAEDAAPTRPEGRDEDG